jgi:hypothetical protein
MPRKEIPVSDSCPAEAWYNSDFLEEDFWPGIISG